MMYKKILLFFLGACAITAQVSNAQQNAEQENQLPGGMVQPNNDNIRQYLITNAKRITVSYLQNLYLRDVLSESIVRSLMREAHMSAECFAFMLETAVENGWFDVVRFLIEEKKISTRPQHATRRTLAHKAAVAGRRDMMQLLLSKDPELASLALPRGYTPLHAAASYGALEVVKLLIEHKVPLDPIYTGSSCAQESAHHQDQRDYCGLTPLHRAASKGCLRIVRCLVRAGARLDIKDKNGLTPYDHALKHKRKDIAEYLSRRQQELRRPSRGNQPSSSSSSNAARPSRKRFRDDEAETRNQKRQSVDFPVYLPGMKEMMLREVTKSCAKEMRGIQASQLYRVTKPEHTSWLTYCLFFYPGLLQIKDATGHGLLHYAAAHGNLEGYLFLKGKGASLADRTSEGATVLHYAAIGGNCAIIQDLLNAGLSKTDKCGELMTPYDFALMCEYTDAACLLQADESHFYKILTHSRGDVA